MCNKVDNNCREEKRGCEGCYYNGRRNGITYIILLNTIIKAIETDKKQTLFSTDSKNNFLFILNDIYVKTDFKIQYIVRENNIEVINHNKIRVNIVFIEKKILVNITVGWILDIKIKN